MVIGRRSLLLAGVAVPAAAASARAQCVTDTPSVDACLGGVRTTVPPGTTLDLSFGGPTLDPRITFTRASTATYFDATGTMQTAATNAPRFDSARGLLLEEARTNLVFPSVIGGASWIANGTIASGGSVVLPTGAVSTTALFYSTDTGNSARSYNNATSVISATTAYTVSAYLRKDATNACIQVNCTGGTTVASVAYYDLTAGTAVVGADLIAGLTAKSATITAISGGWYRATFSFTTVAGNTAANVYVAPCMVVSATGDNRGYTGVVGQGVYVWGVQVEAGAFPTSYIPTTAAAATRAVDVASMSWVTSGSFSHMAEGMGHSANNATVMELDDGTTTNGTQYYIAGNGNIHYQMMPGFDTVLAPAGAAGAAGAMVIYKIAAAFAPGAQAGALNGALGTSNTFATLPPASTTLRFGAQPGGGLQNTGYIRRARYWPRVLSNAELQQVTR